MADIESNIDINIDASNALAAIKQLQAQISAFHQAMSKSGAEAAAKSAQMQNKLVDSINSTGKWSASIKTVQTSTESFTTALEKNKFSLGEYFKFGASQVTGFRKIFSTEFDTIDKVARERVKTLQTQYIKLGRDANGAMKSIAVRPLELDMNNLGTQVAMTAQKQQILNEVLKQGSTNLLNFGKNTQWAGRQLMVGFTIPLSIFGATAAREFMKIEEQTIRLQRVYGDFSTSAEQTDKMTESIKNLALEFTKYGIAVDKTIGLAADAAAMGKTGADLTAQVAEASRLAVLGGVEQAAALETTTSLTNAFGVATDKLSGKVNFLNAVENQTVTSIQDLTEAIPKAGPVVQQLGGNVEDLAFFLTAMKEGGINASEGANALKSGLASIINPGQDAVDMLNSFGINIKGIVDANKGDIKATVVGLADALNQLDPLNRAQAIETLFGKFQFARISTLFQNITSQSSQANKVLQLTMASTEELAVLSEREMKKVSDSPMYKFQSAVEKFQAALAPIGETFLKAVTPIINFGTDILNKFNEMGDGAKQFWVVVIAAVAGLGPVLLMTFGLLANGVANIVKLFAMLRNGLNALSGGSKILGGDTSYMSQAQLEAASVAASLNQIHQDLIQTITSETSVVLQLANAYQAAATAANGITARMNPAAGGGPKPKKYADGVYTVPGPKGAGDIVPAMLSPGEAVIPSDRADQYRGLIQGIIAGNIPGFDSGTSRVGRVIGGPTSGKKYSLSAMFAPGNTANGAGMDLGWLANGGADVEASFEGAIAAGYIISGDARATQANFKLFSDDLGSVTGELLDIFRGEITPATQNVAEVAQTAYPKIIAHINQLEQEGRLSADEATKLRASSRMLMSPSEQDLTQTEIGRVELSNVDGQTVVHRVGNERTGRKLRAAQKRATSLARVSRGLPGEIPEDYSWAHLTDSPTNPRFDEPTGSRGTPEEQAVIEMLRRGQIPSKGQVITASDQLVNAVNEAGDMNSPSRRITEAGENLVAGLEQGIESGTDNVKAAGKKLGGATLDPESAAKIRAEAVASETQSLKDQGLLGATVNLPTPEVKKKVTKAPKGAPVDANGKMLRPGVNMTDPVLAALNAQAKEFDTNSPLYRAANRFGQAMDSVAEKYPILGGMIDKLKDKLGERIIGEDQIIDANGNVVQKTQQQLAGDTLNDGTVSGLTQQQQDAAILKESKRQKRQKLAGRVMGAGFIASSALGMMAMGGGPMAEFAQNAAPIAGVATTVLPMLISMGPVLGSIVAALGLVAAGLVGYNNMLSDARDKGIRLAESFGVGEKAMKGFAEFAGKATSKEIGDKIREKIQTPFAVQSDKETYGQSYVKSDQGKAQVKNLKETIDKLKLSANDAGNRLGQQLANAVADNLMTQDQARSIAANLGVQLGDQTIGINAIGQLNKLVGPNGENLKESGIDLKVNLLKASKESIVAGVDYIKEQANLRAEKKAGLTQRYADQYKAKDSWGQIGSGIEGLGQDIGNLFAPLADAATAAGMMATNLGQAVEQSQRLIDATDQYWTKIRDAALVAGNISSATDAETARILERNRLLKEQADMYSLIDQQVKDSNQGNSGFLGINDTSRIFRDQTWETQRKSIEAKLGASGINAANAVKDQGNELATNGITETRQIKILAALDAGTLTPSAAEAIVNIANRGNEGDMETVMRVITEFDATTAQEIMNVAQFFKDPTQQTTFLAHFTTANPEEAQQWADTFNTMQKVANADKALEFTLSFFNQDKNALDKANLQLTKLKKVADKDLSITMLSSIVGIDPAQLAGYADWFAGLPPEQMRAFSMAFTDIYNTVGSPEGNKAVEAWQAQHPEFKGTKEQAGMQWAAEQAKSFMPSLVDITTAQENTTANDTGSGGGGGGGRTGSILDDLLQKLRRLQIATIDLTEGWAGAREALDNLFPGGASNSPFQGIEQQMRRLGAKEDLISLIAGMDPEEFQKRKDELFTFDGAGNIAGFRDSLLSIGAAFRSINLGNFQNEQQKSIATIGDQNTAIRKLIANGYSLAEAYDMVKDAAFASAVAQEGNNDIIRQATEQYKEGAKQAKLFAAAQAAATANTSTSDKQGMLAFINANVGNLSNAVIQEMLNNQDFATLLMSPNLTQEQKDALQQWINNIENSAELNMQVNLTNIDGMEKIFEDGFNKAMEAFSAQEKKIEIEFAVKKDPFQQTVQNAQNLIADIQNRPGGMDDLQADLDRIDQQEQEINKKYKKRTDALDQIKKQNDRLIQQRKAELTVADAITQGDISAAAKAIEDARAQQAQNNMQAQSDMLQRQKEAEFAALTGQMGLTREQIETRVRDLKQEIFNIEESTLEPAQYQLSLLERQEARQKASLTVLGMTRREWETLKNRIDVAKTSSDEYKKAMEAARDVVGKIVDYWTEIQKPKTTVHTIVTVYETQGSPGAPSVPASGDPSGGGNPAGGNRETGQPSSGGTTNNTINSIGGKTANQWLEVFKTLKAQYTSYKNSGTPTLQALATGIKGKANDALANYYKINDSHPGSIHNIAYLASGGFAKAFARGTDTIPAMLTPGEFVITKPAVEAYGASMMKDINNGTFKSGSVYNYSVNVNVETDADANQIATAVMKKIKNIDSMRIQGNRF
jgi:TP901 family phage tail tape measure protein